MSFRIAGIKLGSSPTRSYNIILVALQTLIVAADGRNSLETL